MKKIGSNPPKQPRLKGLLKIIQADEGQRGDILVGELHRILKRTITPEIEQDLESIAEQGSLLDHIVAYNRIWDVDIHLTYQRNRRKKGKEVMNSADKPDRAYLRSLLNDVKDEGYFWKKVVLPNLEKRERVLGRLTTKGSDIYTWREAVVIQNQLGIKGKKQDFESYSERYVELKDKIHYYTDHTDKFQKDFLKAYGSGLR
ncbi:MAG: hypothetical protein U9O94_00065 [Nanoarchaeota archaeon]|nr:hypothetical protein [Nanoarchaeota archaeon]